MLQIVREIEEHPFEWILILGSENLAEWKKAKNNYVGEMYCQKWKDMDPVESHIEMKAEKLYDQIFGEVWNGVSFLNEKKNARWSGGKIM